MSMKTGSERRQLLQELFDPSNMMPMTSKAAKPRNVIKMKFPTLKTLSCGFVILTILYVSAMGPLFFVLESIDINGPNKWPIDVLVIYTTPLEWVVKVDWLNQFIGEYLMWWVELAR